MQLALTGDFIDFQTLQVFGFALRVQAEIDKFSGGQLALLLSISLSSCYLPEPGAVSSKNQIHLERMTK